MSSSALIIETLKTVPKYVGFIIALSIFLDYERNPVWNDWRWKVIIPFSFINILLIFYSMYKNGIDISIIFNLIWLFVYVMILRFYMLKFDSAETVKNNISNDPLKSGKWFKWLAGIGLTLSIIVLVCSIIQFIPIVRPVALIILNILQLFI